MWLHNFVNILKKQKTNLWDFHCRDLGFDPWLKTKILPAGTSLMMVQWLRSCFEMQGKWVQTLVRELRSHMQWSK